MVNENKLRGFDLSPRGVSREGLINYCLFAVVSCSFDVVSGVTLVVSTAVVSCEPLDVSEDEYPHEATTIAKVTIIRAKLIFFFIISWLKNLPSYPLREKVTRQINFYYVG